MQLKTALKAIAAASLTFATACQAAETGKPAPGFTAKNLKGQDVSLADFQGKVVVLEWNNFDCPFVKKHYASGNIPKMQQSLAAKGVVWLTVCSSAAGKGGYLKPAKMTERAAKEGNKATHFLMDSDGAVGKAYGAKVTPHMFVIGKDGTLLYDGAIDSKATTDQADIAQAENYVAAAVDAALAGKAPATAKTQPYGCGVKY
jgi:peroxiredoxin